MKMLASPSVVVRDGVETLALYNVKIDEEITHITNAVVSAK
jgi:hypothetical protein